MRSSVVVGVLGVVVGCGAPAANPSEPLANKPASTSVSPPAPDLPPIDGDYVRGEIRVHPKAHSRVVANTSVFILVKRVGADGQPTGVPFAASKLAWAEPLPFTLSTEHLMVADDQPWGDVFVKAWYDQDGDALSKQAGDIVGTTRVHAPADGVVVVLDDVVP